MTTNTVRAGEGWVSHLLLPAKGASSAGRSIYAIEPVAHKANHTPTPFSATSGASGSGHQFD